MDPVIVTMREESHVDNTAHTTERIEGWTPQSWLLKPVVAQAVEYEDPKALLEICHTISSLPPLVSPVKIEIARARFQAAALGKAFILQAGDCAESFHDVRPTIIQQKIKLLEEQCNLLSHGLHLPVVKVGRIAGQYAKPRSSPFETLPDGSKIHAFRGHNVNGMSLDERVPDPQRLLLGYFHSKATMDLMKTYQGPLTPGSGKVPSSINHPSMTYIPTPSSSFDEAGTGAIFTSHEALHLPFETAVTHNNYNTSASFIWVGERTRQLDGGHLEYIRGLRNPLGIKVGPGMTGKELVELLNVINPNPSNTANIGHVTIITRLGVDNVDRVLPSLIQAVAEAGHRPVWMCDPCHGNTQTVSGIKTRCVDRMLAEVVRTYDTHRRGGSFMGGLHLEQTGEEVTECLNHSFIGDDHGLDVNYRSLCDPRLSNAQALVLVRKFVEFVQVVS